MMGMGPMGIGAQASNEVLNYDSLLHSLGDHGKKNKWQLIWNVQ